MRAGFARRSKRWAAASEFRLVVRCGPRVRGKYEYHTADMVPISNGAVNRINEDARAE
jgi:hypothetical protein